MVSRASKRPLPATSKWLIGAITTLLAVALVVCWTQVPAIGAGALLHPVHRRTVRPAPNGCVDATFDGAGVALRGWRCTPPARLAAPPTPPRATIVYLHGIADNRGSATGLITRFLPLGYDVIAYDSRANGDSDGNACTYGYYEKQDLHRVIDTIAGPVVLIGASLGGAVALQEAADDSRVNAIVAAETFSDLRTVASERAPWIFSDRAIEQAFLLAGREAKFDVDAVSPVRAAARITVPVLLIHGAADIDTPPAHSRRVFDQLRGPKRLILVPGAAHNESLRPEVWNQIEAFVRGALAPRSSLLAPRPSLLSDARPRGDTRLDRSCEPLAGRDP
jgi:pimeloyl-ACP methyl ester carboxylesterase